MTYVAYYPGSNDVIDLGANIATVTRALYTHPGSRIAALSWWVRFG